MIAPLAEVLLRIAAAVAADGGAGVRRALETALREAAPFDAGEIVFVRAHGEHAHLPLGGDERPLLGADLVAYVLAQGAPYRVDDWPDVLPFAQAHDLLRERDLRSALVLPFRFEVEGTEAVLGVLAVARAHGWAYVGASLPLLVPLAGMAGLAVDRALTLSALAAQADARVPASPWGASAGPEQPGGEAARVESEADRVEAHNVAEGLRQARNAARELRSRAEAAEQRLLEAERARDDWAERAASLQARLSEKKAELQSLQRAVAGARETAAAAADLAEARETRARELELRVRALQDELREARQPAQADPEPPGPPPAPSRRWPFERRARRRTG
jgi:hypothetical protein